jgi:serine phosphatase RsbU (regulator of sigma subunit)
MFFRRKKKDVSSGDGAVKKVAPVAGPDAAALADSLEQSTQFLTGDADIDRRTIQVLLEAIAQVSESSADLDSLLRVIVDRSIEVTGAERGLLLMRDQGEELSVHVARSSAGEEITDDLRFSTSIARKVADELEPVRATVNTDAEALDLGRSVFDLKLRAVMCVPLTASRNEGGGTKVSGVLYVDSRAATRQFSRNNLRVFAALARQISVALENARLHLDSMEKMRLEQNEEVASAIQRDLMPRIPDNVPGFELFGWYGPADRTSGDFYDFGRAKDGRLAIVVGDATGHGVGPALITATAQAGLRSYMRMLSDVGEIITYLNQDLCERVEDGRFLTLFLAVLAQTGEVEFLNAGHCDPFVWRKSTGEFDALSGRNPALGMIDQMTFVAGEPIVLEEGDVLVAFTDGIVEARDPANPDVLFGVEGLRQAVADNTDKSTKDLTLALVERALELSGGVREDDITVVVARRVKV